MTVKRLLLVPVLVIGILSAASVTWVSMAALHSNQIKQDSISQGLEILRLTGMAQRDQLALDGALRDALEPWSTASTGAAAAEFAAHANTLGIRLAEIDKAAREAGLDAKVRPIAIALADFRGTARLAFAQIDMDLVPQQRELLAESAALTALIEQSASILLRDVNLRIATLSSGTERSIRLGMIVIFALTLLVGTCAAVFASRLAHHLAHLTDNMDRLAKGDVGVRINGLDRNDELGSMARSLGVFAEAIQRDRASKAEMEAMAQTDSLTGLPNRRGLFQSLESALKAIKNSDRQIGVLHIDLDHFKAVNDSLGHDAGDFVLTEAAQRMSGVLRGSDVLARIGGDEFIAVIHNVNEDGEGTIERAGERIVRCFDAPIVFKDTTCPIGVSAGAALSGAAAGAITADALLSCADVALAAAKNAGRGRVAIFTSAMEHLVQSVRTRAGEIKDGLLDGQFRPWFQPVVTADGSKITGLEVLTRWHHPDRGVLPPSEFIAAAETHKMLEQIGATVLEQACKVFSDLRFAGHNLPRLHINLGRGELLIPAIVDRICWTLDELNIAPELIAVEINEASCIGRSSDLVFQNACRLADRGIGIVLDNFGAEQAALVHVTRLQIQKAKVARSAISGMFERETAREARELVAAMVAVARSLNVQIVGKGAEDAEQQSFLTALGFQEFQSDSIAPAMEEGGLRLWLDSFRTAHDSVTQRRYVIG